MPDPARTLHRTQRSLWISLVLGVLATTVLVSTLVLAVLITLQIQELSEGVAYSQTIVNSNMRALSQAQREILRLVNLLEQETATAEQLDLLRGFISQRTQEASLSYQVYTLGSEELYAVSLALRDEWRDAVEPLIRQIAEDPENVNPALRARAIDELQTLELGYNRLVSDGEINRRLQGAALNQSAQSTLDATRSVILVLGLSAVAFIGLAAVAAWNFARLTRQREVVARELVAANRQLQLLSAVASRTRNLVIITDGQGRIEWVNDAFVTQTGYTLPESLGKSPGDMLQGEGSDATVVQYMGSRIHAGEPFEAEILNYARDGREYWIAIEAQPVLNENGATTHYVAVETDITSRKQTESALRAALEQERETRELKSRFVTMTSHEFRTPLTTILTTADFLKMADSTLTPDQRGERLDKIERAARHIAELMDDVLHYDRADAAWLQFAPQPVDLSALVRSVADEIASSTHRQVVCSVPDEPAVVSGDRAMLRQIASNLLTNAAKYSPADQPIDVTVGAPGDCVTLCVRDHGIGIPDSEQRRIFEPFYRAANTSGVSGTGLGLAITRNAVELHGGQIAFESKEGQGTVFTVRLPLERLPEATP